MRHGRDTARQAHGLGLGFQGEALHDAPTAAPLEMAAPPRPVVTSGVMNPDLLTDRAMRWSRRAPAGHPAMAGSDA